MEEQSKVFKSADPSFLVRKKIIKYVKISHPSLTHNDKFDKEGYTITLCYPIIFNKFSEKNIKFETPHIKCMMK